MRLHDQKKEERRCAQALKEYLESQGRIVSYEPAESDPPDFWFTVDGEMWAVEHTKILTQSGPNDGDTEKKAFDIGQLIISRVEHALEKKPRLDSGWTVAVMGFVPKNDINTAVANILNAITRLEVIDSGELQVVFRTSPWSKYSTQIIVQRREDLVCGIYPCFSGSAYGGDFDKLAHQVVSVSIKKKIATELLSAARTQQARVVILLDGEGFFATADVVSHEFKRISSDEPTLVNDIDRIFLVRRHPFPPGETVSCVYSDQLR